MLRKNKENEGLDDAGGQNANENDAESYKKRREKLVEEIQELKKLNFLIECNLEIPKFGNVRVPDEMLKHSRTAQFGQEVVNVDNEIVFELCQYAGVHCKQLDGNEYVFNFLSSSASVKKELYAVQIFNDDGEGKSGNWVMPESIDMDEILSETPIKEITNLKKFLRNCRHHINCYISRMDQYHKLKAILGDTKNCSLETDFGYSQITLQLLRVKEIGVEATHDVLLYLFYESGNGRPSELKVDTPHTEMLSEDTTKKLKKYFKSFKLLSLAEAFEKTVKTKDLFSWEGISMEETFIDLDGDDSRKTETFLSAYKRKREGKGNQLGTKRKKIEKANESDRNLSSQPQREKDLSADQSNAEVGEEVADEMGDLKVTNLAKNKALTKRRSTRKKQTKEKQKENVESKSKEGGEEQNLQLQDDLKEKPVSSLRGELHAAISPITATTERINAKDAQKNVGNLSLKGAKGKSVKTSTRKLKSSLKQATLNFNNSQPAASRAVEVNDNNRQETMRKSIRWIDEIGRDKTSLESTLRTLDSENLTHIMSSTPIRGKANERLKIELSAIQKDDTRSTESTSRMKEPYTKKSTNNTAVDVDEKKEGVISETEDEDNEEDDAQAQLLKDLGEAVMKPRASNSGATKKSKERLKSSSRKKSKAKK